MSQSGAYGPASPSIGTTRTGVSYIKIGGELEAALGVLKKSELMENICKIVDKLHEDTNDYSIAVFDKHGHAAIAEKQDGNIIWKYVERDEKSCTEQRCIVKLKREIVEIKGNIIKDAALARRENKQQNLWWISISTCKSRLESLLAQKGEIHYRRDFVPSFFRATTEGVILNIKKTYQTKRTESNRLELEKIIGIPEFRPTVPIDKIVAVDESCKDEKIKKQLQALKNYVVTEKTDDEEKDKLFLQIVQRIARIGHPDDQCMKILNSIKEGKKGNNRARYRIGAYLPNSNIVLEYTHLYSNTKETGWFPLSYSPITEDRTKLRPIKDEDRHKVASIMRWDTYERLQPRIICCIQNMNGKKIVNGQIYDLYYLRQTMEDIPTIAKYSRLPASALLAVTSDFKYNQPIVEVRKESQTRHNNPKANPETPSTCQYERPMLPYQVMAECNERAEHMKKYFYISQIIVLQLIIRRLL